MKDRQAFLEERQTGIGGSDVHHLLNLRPWGCSRKLWYQKMGIPPDYEELETAPMKRGTRLEEIAAEEYYQQTGRDFRRQGIKRMKDRSFIFVHMDRQLFTAPTAMKLSTGTFSDGPGVLEIKVPGQFPFKAIQKDGLPMAYYLQLQYSLLVTGYQWGSFAVFWADGWTLLWWDVERDQKLVDSLKENAITFWEDRVMGESAPDRLESKDARCKQCAFRRQCQGEALLKLIKEEKGARIETDLSILDAVEQYQRMKLLKAEAEELCDSAQADLKKILGDRTLVETTGYRCHFKPQTTRRINTKLLKAKEPAVWEKYVNESVSRPLRVFSI